MKKTDQRFYPGDRVRITEDIDELEIERPDQTFIVGTKGSIGIIVTPEEFWADYVERMRQQESLISKYHENPVNFYESILSKEHEKSMIAGVKSNMEANFRYPVKFETVEAAANPEAVICCKVGECQLILVSMQSSIGEIQILEKIEETHQ